MIDTNEENEEEHLRNSKRIIPIHQKCNTQGYSSYSKCKFPIVDFKVDSNGKHSKQVCLYASFVGLQRRTLSLYVILDFYQS